MLTISDNINLSDEDSKTILNIIMKYGYDNFNLIMFREREGIGSYEVCSYLKDEAMIDALADILQSMLIEIRPIRDSLRKDC